MIRGANAQKARLWCDPSPSDPSDDTDLPNLRAVVLDFSSVNNLDITAVQGLSHIRATLDVHAAPDIVDWHFACVQNRWTRRTLAIAGFGYPSEAGMEHWTGAYALAPLARRLRSVSRDAESEKRPMSSGRTTLWGDDEREEAEQADAKGKGGAVSSRVGTVYGVNRPYFHADLAEAVEVAARNAREKDRRSNGVV